MGQMKVGELVQSFLIKRRETRVVHAHQFDLMTDI